jgi:hypothetical protein
MISSTGKSSTTAANLFVACVSLVLFSSRLPAQDYPPRPLPDDDRRTLTEYLGNGVVGEAISPPALTHGISDLISFRDNLSWRMRVVSPDGRGTEQRGFCRILSRHDGGGSFILDTGDGRNVFIGQLDASGNLLCYATQDNQQAVISRYDPPQPLFLAGLTPGETRGVNCSVSVADLSRPDVQAYSGHLYVELTYVGAYRVRVPAGAVDAVLVKTRLTGKVGPADVRDVNYRFFAKNFGPAAVVETDDVSAFLLYNQRTRIGKVLVETIAK